MAASSQNQEVRTCESLEDFQTRLIGRPFAIVDPFWRHFVSTKLGRDGVERLQVIYVDARDGYVHDQIAATGCAQKVAASAQTIIEFAHRVGSVGFYLAHNHPSGSARPSKTDIVSTEQLIERALDRGLFLRDHLILAGDSFFSLRRGKLV